MPTLRPMIAGTGLRLDLDVDAGGKVEAHERVDRLRRGRVDVDEPLVGADLEVLPRVLVLEGTPDHAVDVALGRQRHRARDGRAAPLGRLHDRRGALVDELVVIGLEADSDLVLLHRARVRSGRKENPAASGEEATGSGTSPAYSMMLSTTPAPTVRSPSRIAKRRPSSMAIGWMSSTSMVALSPGM